jgi:hypothetical protein
MNILTPEVEKKINSDIIKPVLAGKYDLATGNIPHIIDELYANIPENKRISYGIVHVVKTLSEYLYTHLTERNAQVYRIALRMLNEVDDFKRKSVALGMLSYYGLGD